jgi:methionyl-tRNA formyltransferase
MRIVFIGNVEFSLEVLKFLVKLEAEIVGVCTSKESEFNSDHVDLSSFAQTHGISSFYAKDINSKDSLNWIESKKPDIIFCFGWSWLIKKNILELAPLGVVGFHPAALPENRGRHPIIWALVLGLKKTASTFFFMDEGVDTGDILSQKEVLIPDRYDARDLYLKIIEVALEQIECFLPILTLGNYERKKQNLLYSNIWRKRVEEDGLIDWRMSANSIHNLVRGLAKPYPGSHFLLNGKQIKVFKTSIYEGAPKNIEPGKVLDKLSGGTIVKCGEGAIILHITEPPTSLIIGSYL